MLSSLKPRQWLKTTVLDIKRSQSNNSGLRFYLPERKVTVGFGFLAIRPLLKRISLQPEVEALMNPYVKLRNLMDAHFNETEIRSLCFELNIDFENLGGENKLQKIENLIQYAKRRQKLVQLLRTCRTKRSFADWPNPVELEQAASPSIFISPADTQPQQTSGGRKRLTTSIATVILIAVIGYIVLQLVPWPLNGQPTREGNAQDTLDDTNNPEQEIPSTRAVVPEETDSPTEVPLPDLVVKDFAIEPAPVNKFQPVTVRFNIVNEGGAAAGPFGWQWFSAGSTMRLEGTENGLEPGAGLQIERTYSYSGCSLYTTSVAVDSANAISELDEGNNVQTLELPVSCLAYITFNTFPDGTPISDNTQLQGDEFSDWNIYLSSHAAGDYGEGSVPFIMMPGYRGTTANFLTTGNPGDPPAGAAGPFQLAIDFESAVSFVRIYFRGAEGQTYRMFLFDDANNQIGVDSITVSSDDVLTLEASLPEPSIQKLIFGLRGAVTIVEAVAFE